MNFKRFAAMAFSVVMMCGAIAWIGDTEAYAASVVGRGVKRTATPAAGDVSGADSGELRGVWFSYLDWQNMPTGISHSYSSSSFIKEMN